ncbi:single-stranded-DNA-specific exonuclease RecJ [Paenibacillus sp. CF384]|uniref:single-stranded-DNA-specific exonuclease RecJ n=1 Tax=Paenibacillus sp. CF384 TaxID=1884382 RepID=UPI00210CF82A|nr:single-stranded-DNA-specific exonuclease RecJ [Paenibacillus sp. CF384]
MQSKTRWSLASFDLEAEARAAGLARSLSLSPLVARLLVQRGYDRVESARQFLNGGIECLHDPFLLKGMNEAVTRIRAAVQRGERVRIYGDYDCDGVSSTTLMSYLFTRLELNFDYYIPHRTLEGYGLNKAALRAAADSGITLIVTVDTGISAVEEIAYANELGIDIVVTDHHEPPHQLPEAYAIVNPKQEDCGYPFKGLAGVGVAFKLAQALLDEPPIEWTDVVALGTIADLMPLKDENRVLVRLGLEQLRQTEKPGFRALAEVGGIELASLVSSNVAFGMAPRINAAGRLEHAQQAVALLTSTDHESAAASAISLDALNRQRQLIVETIVQEAQEMWMAKCKAAAEAGVPEPSVIVLAGEGWNVGVVGIVASKFIEKYYKPTLILGIDTVTGKSKGSARSIEGYDLHAALTECDALLDHYGGHQAAAGMTLHRDNLEAFEAQLSGLADSWLTEEDWIPKTMIDLSCKMEDATLRVREQLAHLEPFGIGNEAPKLLLTGVTLADRKAMGKESKHLKLSISGQGKLLDAISFGSGHLTEHLSHGAAIELVGELSVNEWNGQRKAQFMVNDLRVPHIQVFDKRGDAGSESLPSLRKQLAAGSYKVPIVLVPSEAWLEAAAQTSQEARADVSFMTYDAFMQQQKISCSHLFVFGRPPSAEKLSYVLAACEGLEAVHLHYDTSQARPAFPTREQFGDMYKLLRRECPLDEEGISKQLASKLSGTGESTITLMLKVFTELEFIHMEEGQVKLSPVTVKRELSHSAEYRDAQRIAEWNEIISAPIKRLTDWIIKEVQNSLLHLNEGVVIS